MNTNEIMSSLAEYIRIQEEAAATGSADPTAGKNGLILRQGHYTRLASVCHVSIPDCARRHKP